MSCCAQHQALSSSSTFLLNAWTSSPYVTSALLGPPLLLLLLLYPALLFLTPKERELPSSAFQFVSSDNSSPVPLPRLVQQGQSGEKGSIEEEIQLSIVIPAYNEEERLTLMLDEAIAHLQKICAAGSPLAGASATAKRLQQGEKGDKSAAQHALCSPLKAYEILIVDDGSRDKTAQVALEYAASKKLGSERLRLVRLGQNCGKGKAVRHGVLHTRGQLVAFCDADGATRFSDVDALAAEMSRIVTPAGHGIVCGSRAHLVGSDAVVKRSFARNLLMHSFHFILSLLMRPPNPFAIAKRFLRAAGLERFVTTVDGKRASLPTQPPIRDTQCGFKLLTRASAAAIFPLAHIDRWIFDVELLLLAEMASSATLSADPAAAARAADAIEAEGAPDPLLWLPLPISEVAVDWKEVAGSKIDILKDSVKMGLDLVVIRLNYALGRWRRPAPLQTAPRCCGESLARKHNGSAAAAVDDVQSCCS